VVCVGSGAGIPRRGPQRRAGNDHGDDQRCRDSSQAVPSIAWRSMRSSGTEGMSSG
jgi:hypothetical protein